MEEQARLIGCLDDTGNLILMHDIVPMLINAETSTCVQAGLEGDPHTAMGGSMAGCFVTTPCLSDEEWAADAPRLGNETTSKRPVWDAGHQ